MKKQRRVAAINVIPCTCKSLGLRPRELPVDGMIIGKRSEDSYTTRYDCRLATARVKVAEDRLKGWFQTGRESASILCRSPQSRRLEKWSSGSEYFTYFSFRLGEKASNQ